MRRWLEYAMTPWLHTLGNLTLTCYNAEYSDRPFAEKRNMKGGFRESPLRMNEGLGELDRWDETTIRAPYLGSYPFVPSRSIADHRSPM